MSDTAVKEIYIPSSVNQAPLASKTRMGNDYSPNGYIAPGENLAQRGKKHSAGTGTYQNQMKTREEITSATDLKEIYAKNARPQLPRANTDDKNYDKLSSNTAIKEAYLQPTDAQAHTSSNTRISNNSSSSGYIALDENLMLESQRRKKAQQETEASQYQKGRQTTSATGLKEAYTRNAVPPVPNRKHKSVKTDDHEYDKLDNTANNRHPYAQHYAVMYKDQEKRLGQGGHRRKQMCLGLLVLLLFACVTVVCSLVPTLVVVKRIETALEAAMRNRNVTRVPKIVPDSSKLQPSQPPPASDLRIVHDGTCYCLYDKSRNWPSARDFCFRHNETVFAEIRSKAANDVVVPILASTGRIGVWLGGSDRLVQGNLRWDYSNLPVETFAPSQWASGEPSGNFRGASENCIEARKYDNGLMLWNDADCEKQQSFLCQSPVGADNRCGC